MGEVTPGVGGPIYEWAFVFQAAIRVWMQIVYTTYTVQWLLILDWSYVTWLLSGIFRFLLEIGRLTDVWEVLRLNRTELNSWDWTELLRLNRTEHYLLLLLCVSITRVCLGFFMAHMKAMNMVTTVKNMISVTITQMASVANTAKLLSLDPPIVWVNCHFSP